MTTIIVTHEDNEIDKFEFQPEQTVITLGRRTTNDVCISDLSVSGNHATLTLKDGEVILNDLGSTNGSYVNGEVVSKATVSASDEIILGKIQLTIKTDAHTTVGRPTAATTADMNTAPPARAASEGARHGSQAAGDLASDLFSGNNDVTKIATPVPGFSDTPIAGNSMEQAANAKAPPQSSNNHPLQGLEQKVAPSSNAGAAPMHELDLPASPSNGAVIEIKNGAKSGQILPIDKPVTTLGRPGIQIAAIMRKPDGYFLMHIESDDSVDRPTLNSDAVGDEPVLLHSGDALTVAGIDVEFMLS